MDEFPRRLGPYILLKPLARGGMGALYLAVSGERGMEKLCVIKTVLPHLADAEYLRRFRDEAKVVVKLSHGNLVGVFDAGQVDGTLYLSMDFVEGRDLRATWNRCAHKGIAFPVDVAAYIVKELARGLGYAHAFGGLKLVHRDVSPPNVLLAYTGEVKLTDFGLASSTIKLEKTAPGVIYGKVSYMAPEQARGEPMDGRTDLYAAGIILWELLTGRQLFPAAQPGGEPPVADELLKKVRNPKVDPPSARAARVPADLDRIALRALCVSPADRYASGEELRSDLAAYLARTAPSTDADRVARFLRDLFGEDIEAERIDREELVSAAVHLFAPDPTLPSVPLPKRGLGESASDGKFREVGQTPLLAGAAGPPASDAPDGFIDAGGTSAATLRAADAGSADIVGTVVGGRYYVKRMCGEGGMGKVYEAEHVEIGKRVALKVLHPVYTRTPEVVERFRREARAASKIGHPNVVDVTDSGNTPGGSFYFVMEYVEGVELGLVLHREGQLPVPRALAIGAQICRGIAAAHEAGVIHRDLKPENVLLVQREGQSDFVKVLDFGIAKHVDVDESEPAAAGEAGRRLTHPGMAMGTPEYMAPEQAAGRQADARTDIYAVGAIIYEMLAGRPPFEGQNFMEILHKKANETPKRLSILRADVPASVEALLERAMAREPDGRPPSMSEFEREIVGVLDGTPSAAPGAAISAPVVGSAPVRRGPSPRVVAVVGAGALAAAALFAWRLATAPPPPPRPIAVAVRRTGPPPPAPAARAPVLPPPPAPPPAPSPSPAAPVGRPSAGASAGARAAAADASRRSLADGQRLLAAGRFAEARGAFQKSKETKATRGAALVGLGQIAFQEGRYPDAVTLLRQSLELGGGVRARLLLGDANFKLQRFRDAARWYGDALEREPGNAAAKTGLSNAQKRLD